LLGNDLGMAIHAEIRHARAAPEGRMTGIAVSAKFCMRADTAKRVARLGIERTRTVKNVILPYHHDCQDHSGQDRKNNAGTGETSNTRIIHAPS
jgi:hypothetical protein